VAAAGVVVLAALSVALAVIEVGVHRLPNALVLPAYPVAAALLLVPALVTGEGPRLPRAVAGMAALCGFYLLLALASPAGMGFGDVKLAGVLGMYLGWLGWPELLVGAFLAFPLGGLFSVAAMALRRAGRKFRIPFGPFMLLGAWTGIFLGEEPAGAYLDTMGG
jgi:leader peptidase (prepilin peptidase) / N-methyltransferase